MAVFVALCVLTTWIYAVSGAPWRPGGNWHGGGWHGGGFDVGHEAIVHLEYATYKGTTLAAGVNQFLGMRYAAAPLGNLRWRAPQEPKKEHGLQNATAFQQICVGTGQQVSDSQAEDCLYINVFAPAGATPKSKLPVWFYIQGGGYAVNSNANYNGTEVVTQSEKGLVLVNFNYRVGALGFLAGEAIRKDGTLNAGLLDQRKALEWVQKYIHLFGGDPDHVVIHGASAGAGSVAYHMAAYGGRDDHLFIGAVPESPFFPTHRTVAESEFQYTQFVDDTGCSGSPDALACLRSKDIGTIQTANVNKPFPGTNGAVPLWSFLPCIDGDFSQDLLYNQFEQGRIVKVPTMIAGDTDEGSLFAANAASPTEVSTFLKANYPKLTTSDLDAINSAYPLTDSLPQHAAYFPSASAAYGDSTFTCPGLTISASISKYLSPAQSWNYRYNVQDQASIAAGLGVSHTSETPAIFGVGYAGGTDSSLATYNAGIVPIVMDYYISFVKTLDPSKLRNQAAPYWAPFEAGLGEERLKIETGSTGMEAVPQELQERCDLWRSLATVMEQK